jgi:periplasmic divalent cation tolerance protein
MTFGGACPVEACQTGPIRVDLKVQYSAEALMIHVTTTCPDLGTARDLASVVVAARLAACGNIVPGVRSVFQWQGRIEVEEEVSLTLKTRADNVTAVVEMLQERHPYDLPVITWEEVGSTPDAEAWLRDETGGD